MWYKERESCWGEEINMRLKKVHGSTFRLDLQWKLMLDRILNCQIFFSCISEGQDTFFIRCVAGLFLVAGTYSLLMFFYQLGIKGWYLRLNNLRLNSQMITVLIGFGNPIFLIFSKQSYTVESENVNDLKSSMAQTYGQWAAHNEIKISLSVSQQFVLRKLCVYQNLPSWQLADKPVYEQTFDPLVCLTSSSFLFVFKSGSSKVIRNVLKI